MSQSVCAKLRVKLFTSAVLPVMLYGLSSLTLKPMHHSMLRGARLKMLRNMAGWRRLEGESWQVTMHRMRERVAGLVSGSTCPEISEQLFSLKWRLARRLLRAGREKWAPHLMQLPALHSRPQGRPPMQWADDMQKFCVEVGERSLQTALLNPGLEEQYVRHCVRKL